MITVIKIKGVIPGLNGDKGLIREHWATAKKSRTKYKVLMMEQSRNRHKGRVRIEYNAFAVELKDWDNHAASFKHLGDALVDAKIIKDDKPSIVIRFITDQIKVDTKKEERVQIIITDLL